jgi:hypothetical protein
LYSWQFRTNICIFEEFGFLRSPLRYATFVSAVPLTTSMTTSKTECNGTGLSCTSRSILQTNYIYWLDFQFVQKSLPSKTHQLCGITLLMYLYMNICQPWSRTAHIKQNGDTSLSLSFYFLSLSLSLLLPLSFSLSLLLSLSFSPSLFLSL